MYGLTVASDIYFTRFTDDRRAIKAFGDCCSCSDETAIDYPPVIVVLVLEILMSMLVFAGFWISEFTIDAAMLVAPITGLGEQQIDSNRLVANVEK